MLKNIALLVLMLAIAPFAMADDLNDGIEIDTNVSDDLTLGKNVRFITQKALAKSKSGQKNKDPTNACGSGNIVIGPGSKVKEVINVSTNKGTTAVCGR